VAGQAQHPLRATGTAVAADNADRAGAADAAGPSGPAEQPAHPATSAHTTGDRGGTTVAAGTEPPRRPAIAASETIPAVADHAAVAAMAGTIEAGTLVGGVGVAVAQQDACVRIVGGARTDEDPQDAARLPSPYRCRRR
jgi:hypothetical protein